MQEQIKRLIQIINMINDGKRDKIVRLIQIIDLINDGKGDKIVMSMKEAYDLKEFLREELREKL